MRFKYSHPSYGTKEFVRSAAVTEVVFGRPHSGHHIDVDLRPDAYVSRLHARLSCENDEYWIEDLNSSHGTWVNGQRIAEKTRLLPDDSVRIGQTTIIILSADAPPLPQAVEAASVLPELGMRGQTAILSEPDAPEEPGQPGQVMMMVPDTAPQFSAPDSTADEVTSQARKFYELSQKLGMTISLDQLLSVFVEQLQQAFPRASRGSVLLCDRLGTLLLRDHWPVGRPSVSMTLANRARTERSAFIWEAVSEQNQEPRSTLRHSVHSAIYAPLLWKDHVLGVVHVDTPDPSTTFNMIDLDLVRAFANQAALYIKNQMLQQDLQREAAARSHLLRQFPPAIAERMLKERGRLRLSGEQVAPVTILESDVRGFTTLSATLEPNDVVQMLNEMFSSLTPIIFKYDGTVDKYIGDAILAVFGSPEPDGQQWEKAVRAALEMQTSMRELAERRKIRGLPPCQIGIGIHSGAVVHGFIGSPERMEYTVIGDTVNWASRHCDGADGGEIVISKKVYERVFNLFEVVPKKVMTKHPDREKTIEAYVVTGLADAQHE